MLKSLHLKNFTVFPDGQFTFGKNLNVIIGENGSGKSHLLKAAYCVLAVSSRGAKDSPGSKPTKAYLQTAIANKLRGVFRPDEIGRLARRQAGRSRGEVECRFDQASCDLGFSLRRLSKNEVVIGRTPSEWIQDVPVYLPTCELLTLLPGFVSFYDTAYLPFEETDQDTAILLGAPLAKGARERRIRPLIEPLEQAMDGAVETDSVGRFYLRTKLGRVEMHLVAEGLRKLAMIARLVANGSLLDKGSLFWDEPEANLNPKLMKLVARTIREISQSGIQVFVSTHSLFLLREFHILQQESKGALDTRFFGLHSRENGVEVSQGDTVDDIGDISALDEELEQSERYLETETQAVAV